MGGDAAYRGRRGRDMEIVERINEREGFSGREKNRDGEHTVSIMIWGEKDNFDWEA